MSARFLRAAMPFAATVALAAAGAVSLAAQTIISTVEVSTERDFIPLQSYVAGDTGDCVLFFGGLTDMGLHVFATNAFPAKRFSTDIVVVEKASGALHTGSIGHLSAAKREALTMTAPVSVQFGDTLHIYGGYGPPIVEPDFTTRDTVTTINLIAVRDAILNGQNVPGSAITLAQSDAARVAGAGIVKLSDGNRFALIGGADAFGDYANQGDPIYTDVIHIFDRTVSMTTPIETLDDGQGFSSPMHRRDVNALPLTVPAQGGGMRDGFAVVAGAFESGIFLHDNPLTWGDGDTLPVEDFAAQNSGAYEGPVVALYSERNQSNHLLIYSGLSTYELNASNEWMQNFSSPWTDTITDLVHENGSFQFYDVGAGHLSFPIGQMPWPLTNSKLIVETSIPRSATGQILIDDLPCHTPVLIGRIYGGIAADFPADTPPTTASDAVLDVYITNVETGTPATLAKIANDFGSIISGGVAEVSISDDVYLQARSQFGFSALEPNIIQNRYTFDSAVASPRELHIIDESRLNNPGGSATVAVRNFNSKTFDIVGSYSIGQEEQTMRLCADATDHINGKGRIVVRIRHSVVATFAASGFDAFIDFVGVEALE